MYQKQRKSGHSKLVPVMIDGKQVHVDASRISKQDRTLHHGQTAAGIRVNSAQSYGIGESTIVWASDGAPAVSFLNDDLQVFAKQTLEKDGFKVQAQQ